MKYISIPSQTVEFENGDFVKVCGFAIRQYCVTVNEMMQFCQATGYRTVAERLGEDSYLDNVTVITLGDAAKLGASASCVSALDAISYCDWANLRLPSEAHYMAYASLLGEFESEDAGFRNMYPNGPTLKLELNEILPRLEAYEICEADSKKAKCIWRRGPAYFRTSSWRGMVRFNRRVEGLDAFELFSCFRVIYDSVPE